MSAEAMYQDVILDHYRAKHHYGLREPYTAEVHHVNPTCGDEVTLRVQVDQGTVADVSWEGVGCSISQASTSVLTGLVIGRSVPEAMQRYDEFLALMNAQGAETESVEQLEDAVAFVGVARFPARIKCALLGWAALKDAVSRS